MKIWLICFQNSHTNGKTIFKNILKMSSDVFRCRQMSSDVVRCLQMSSDVFRCPQMSSRHDQNLKCYNGSPHYRFAKLKYKKHHRCASSVSIKLQFAQAQSRPYFLFFLQFKPSPNYYGAFINTDDLFISFL